MKQKIRTKKHKGQKLSLPDLNKEVIRFLNKNTPRYYTPRQILKKIKAANNVKELRKVLDKLSGAGQITKNEEDRYSGKEGSFQRRPSKNSKKVVGILDAIRSGAAFVICDELESDVFIPYKYVNGAYDGDTVEVEVFQSRRGRRLEGRVIAIKKRNKIRYTGVFRRFKNHSIVVVVEKSARFEVELDHQTEVDAQDYDKVLVEITYWPPQKSQSMRGRVERVLGPSGTNEAEMLSLLVEQGFPLEFESGVLEEARRLEEGATFQAEEGRMDMRDIMTLTIDPKDAKDFDDALSYQVLDNGNTQVGVHIADVSYYVQPGSALDREAASRGNSVYLVDRVIPMLPENLSNGLCSLRPNEEKYTFAVLCEFDRDHKLVGHTITKTWIRSNLRLAYEEAQERIETGEGEMADEIIQMNQIAHTLRKRRTEEGSIGFETDEVRFVLDENGKPLSVTVKQRKDAHLMIEDFMLLANRLVARFIASKVKAPPIPFPYRVHDQPDPEKLHDFSLLALEFGIKFKLNNPRQIAESMNELMDKAREDDRYKILVPMAIRSMAKAEYSTENIGHFGLAFDDYCHFTSPIRRYADLVVHRVLLSNLKHVHRSDLAKMEALCTHISSQERKAQEAERASIKYKQAEYLKEHEGEEFEGVIVSIIDKGFFVTLKENLCEGMVPFESLDERFEVDELRSSFTGKTTGLHHKIGDDVRVRIENADLWTRRVDLALVT